MYVLWTSIDHPILGTSEVEDTFVPIQVREAAMHVITLQTFIPVWAKRMDRTLQ